MTKLIFWFRSLGRLTLCTVLFAVVGCDLGGTRIVRVHGTVTRNGQPVPYLFLNFVPDKGRPSWGVTDAEGHFVLHYEPGRDGAEVGKHSIFVAYKQVGGAPENLPLKLTEAKVSVEETSVIMAVVAKYGNSKAPKIVREVSTDDQGIDLELD